MFFHINQFDQATRIHALLSGRGVVAYTADHIALMRSYGYSRGGLTTYFIRVREYSCPSFKAFDDREAIEKANAWLVRNRKRYELSIAKLTPLFPSALLIESRAIDNPHWA